MNVLTFMNQLGESWASFMWIQTVDSTLVLLALGGLWFLLRKHSSAQLGYCLFILVLIKLMIPGQINLLGTLDYIFPDNSGTRGTGVFEFQWGESGGELDSLKTQSSEPAVDDGSVSASSSSLWSSISTWTILMAGWSVIVLVLLIRMIRMQWRTLYLIRNAESAGDDKLIRQFRKLKDIAGVKEPILLLTDSWVTSPVVWGLFRPVLLVPRDMTLRFTVNQIRWVLLHELAHIRRRDNIVVIFQRIMLIIFFFHPGVWLTNWLIDQLREYACDDIALQGSNSSRKDCGEGFLGVVLQANGLPTYVAASVGMINTKTLIRRRLMRILDKHRLLQAQLSYAALSLLTVLAFFVIPYGGRYAIAQTMEWNEIPIVENQRPPARSDFQLVYDSARDVIVMHGGDGGPGNRLHDTWEFDGNKWTLVSMDGPTRYRYRMVYDAARGVCVLFGGYGETMSEPHADTWEWDGKDWMQVAPDTEELGGFYGMAYDPIRQKVVRHGGGLDIQGGGSYTQEYNGTFEWDGNQWTQIAEGPAGIAAMVYDTQKNKLILWTGEHIESPPRWNNVLWELNGTKWEKIDFDNSVEGFYACATAFDTNRGIPVTFGGVRNKNWGFSEYYVSDETYEWDGWDVFSIPTSNRPAARSAAAMTFDSKRNRMILFGGCQGTEVIYNDTWAYSAESSGVSKRVWTLY